MLDWNIANLRRPLLPFMELKSSQFLWKKNYLRIGVLAGVSWLLWFWPVLHVKSDTIKCQMLVKTYRVLPLTKYWNQTLLYIKCHNERYVWLSSSSAEKGLQRPLWTDLSFVAWCLGKKKGRYLISSHQPKCFRHRRTEGTGTTFKALC